VGLGAAAAQSSIAGVRQLTQFLSGEGLLVPSDDGRSQATLAASWKQSADGLTLSIGLRPNAVFHDGSPVDAQTVVAILQKTLPEWMGPVFDDIDSIHAKSAGEIEIRLHRRSNLVAEGLEAPIRTRDNTIGTGPYVPVPSNDTELKANDRYYLGRPAIDRLVVTRYPSVRAAWADLLRDRIDMLYDVPSDAIDSLTGTSKVRLLTFTRHYQYVLAFNNGSPLFKDLDVRRAINIGVDRAALVRGALQGHGVPSSDPIWPQHWALSKTNAPVLFDPSGAAAILRTTRSHVRFTCLVAPQFDRLAVQLKQQLAELGIDMMLQEVSLDQQETAMAKHAFDAVLTQVISGPSIFRTYFVWYSKGASATLNIGNPHFDAALDRVRYAGGDDEYRRAVLALRDAAQQDPPAIFLAWEEGVRGVSTRFTVAVEAGRDPLSTLRLWHPANGQELVNRN
jgi:peptide/nickel transport system substrate-binding protein